MVKANVVVLALASIVDFSSGFVVPTVSADGPRSQSRILGAVLFLPAHDTITGWALLPAAAPCLYEYPHKAVLFCNFAPVRVF
jgi:hypothetical protein